LKYTRYNQLGKLTSMAENTVVVNFENCTTTVFNVKLFLHIPDPKLLPDFFLEESTGLHSVSAQSPAAATATAAPAQSAGSSASAITDPELGKTFSAVQALLNADLVKSVNAVYVFDLKGRSTQRSMAGWQRNNCLSGWKRERRNCTANDEAICAFVTRDSVREFNVIYCCISLDDARRVVKGSHWGTGKGAQTHSQLQLRCDCETPARLR
jgi:hypothetical protein